MDDGLQLDESFNITTADASNISNIFIIDPDPYAVLPEYKGVWDLLKEWNLLTLFPTFCEAEITLERFQYLCPDDIKDLVPKVGPRAEFREKLLIWKKQKFNIDDRTILLDSKISNWMNSTHSQGTSGTYVSFADSLLSVFKESEKGNAILSFYDKNGFLLENHRQDLINIIVEKVLRTEKVLHPSDFEDICAKIETIFPKENKNLTKLLSSTLNGN